MVSVQAEHALQTSVQQPSVNWGVGRENSFPFSERSWDEILNANKLFSFCGDRKICPKIEVCSVNSGLRWSGPGQAYCRTDSASISRARHVELELSCIYSDWVETRISQMPFYSGSIGFERQKNMICKFIVLGMGYIYSGSVFLA